MIFKQGKVREASLAQRGPEGERGEPAGVRGGGGRKVEAGSLLKEAGIASAKGLRQRPEPGTEKQGREGGPAAWCIHTGAACTRSGLRLGS